jgi:hypothetical protein
VCPGGLIQLSPSLGQLAQRIWHSERPREGGNPEGRWVDVTVGLRRLGRARVITGDESDQKAMEQRSAQNGGTDADQYLQGARRK